MKSLTRSSSCRQNTIARQIARWLTTHESDRADLRNFRRRHGAFNYVSARARLDSGSYTTDEQDYELSELREIGQQVNWALVAEELNIASR